MFCKQCGTTLRDNAKFCSKCGAPAAAAEPAQPLQGFAQPMDTAAPVFTQQPSQGFEQFSDNAAPVFTQQPSQAFGQPTEAYAPPFTQQPGQAFGQSVAFPSTPAQPDLGAYPGMPQPQQAYPATSQPVAFQAAVAGTEKPVKKKSKALPVILSAAGVVIVAIVVLAVMIVLKAGPFAGLGAGTGSEPPVTQSKLEALGISKNLAAGNTVQNFAGHSWRVLAVEDGKALLISNDIIDFRAYNDIRNDADWESSGIRSYLNGQFLSDNFTSDEQAVLFESQVSTLTKAGASAQPKVTNDRVFLLSEEEATKYFKDDADRVAKLNITDAQYNAFLDRISSNPLFKNQYTREKADDSFGKLRGEPMWWWLRTPGTESKTMGRVGVGGKVLNDGYDVAVDYGGVRPALRIDLAA